MIANNIEQIIARIKVIVYHNEESMFSVVKVKIQDDNEKNYLTVTGNFPLLEIDEIYKFEGEYKSHPRYGEQLIVSSYEKILPDSKEAIIKYLSSPLFPKIGVKTATIIVEKLGENALNKIKIDNSLLDNLVKEELKQIIIKGLGESTYFDEAVKLFVTQGLSIRILMKIESIYKERMIDIIRENPYQLVEDIDGIGFKIADDFAQSLGIEKLDERRIKAAIIYSVNLVCFKEGDTFTDIESLKKEVKKLIPQLDDMSIEYFISLLIEEEKIINEDERLFSLIQYDAEVYNAINLLKFINRELILENEEEIKKSINIIQENEGIIYDEDQIEAIINCLGSGLSIITGGPGTGKTTIVKALVKVYKQINSYNSIYLCAPTGRASKRLSELTGVEATTIHRLLKWDLHSNTFSINEHNPLDGDLLIIDEFSMVDNFLLYNLLKATKQFSQIILIGDDDQLPSVSPGNVLKDLLDSKLVNTISLNKIYRQQDKSNIISLAHNIKNDKNINDDISDDVVFYTCDNNNIKKIVLEYIKLSKNNGYNDEDIQVLAPMYMGINGIDSLNNMLQNYFNPPDEGKNEVIIGKRIFRENDRILQLKNQNEDDVYNGDIGLLKEITKKGENQSSSITISVDFDGNIVDYNFKDFINITHAYCISIHKSQGSEYPLLIMPISNHYYSMLAKNLLYTGITRAKKKLILIGDYSSFIYGISNKKYKIRKTTLKERLLKSNK